MPSGPWIGDAITAARPQPERGGASRRPRAITRAMDRRIAHDPALRLRPAGLELRLDEGDDRAATVAQHRADRAEHEAQRDERDVDDGDVDRLGQRRRRQASGR